MEETEDLPTKRRKIEDVANHNGDAGSNRNDNTAKTKSPMNYHIEPKAIALIRRLTKSRIIGGASSPQNQRDKDDTDVAIITTNSFDKNQNKDETTSDTTKDISDVIISSAGSSPAHSPKPEDFTMLSTPPKVWAKDKQVDSESVSKNLFEQLDDLDKNRDPIEGNKIAVDTAPFDGTFNEEKPQDEHKNEELVESNSSSAQTQPLNLNNTELKKVLKAMIDEKFKQVEDICQNQGSETLLTERIVRLEEENQSLHEYAAKLEKAVKILLDNQKNKKDRLNKSAQTEHVFTKATAVAQNTQPQYVRNRPQVIPLASPTQAPQPINQVNKQGTQVTSRLTATQAAIPGHSVTPASLPQRATYTQQQIRVASPTLKPPQAPRVSQYTSSGAQLGVPTSPTRRPPPVTVTVHPQTTTATMIPSSYPAQVQKSTYVTNTVASQPRPPVAQQQIQRIQAPQPMVVYQRPPGQQQAPQVSQPVQQYPNSLAIRSPPNSRPVTQAAPHHISAVNNQPRLPQHTPSNFQQVRPQGPPNVVVSPRNTVVANQDQAVNNYQHKDLPGKPVVSIAVVSNGIVLSWNMQNATSTTRIARYQLFALQDTNSAQWKKIGVVNALPLPMACTLTQFLPGNKYHFTVRAQDEHGRCGPLSEPCTVTLT